MTVARPEPKTIRRTITQPGQIEAFDVARLYAKIPSYVEKYLVDIGDVVHGPRPGDDGHAAERGQVLAELSAPELEEELQQKKSLVSQASADVEQAQAAVKVAQAEAVSAEALWQEAKASMDRVEADYERWASEYGRVVQLVSRSAVTAKLADETKAQLQAAAAARKETEARIVSTRSAMAASQAMVDKSQADEVSIRARRQVAEAEEARLAALVSYLKIEAPFDGTVSERNADIGFYAQSGGGAAAKPLFTVVRTDRMRVFVDLPEMDVPLVKAGDAAVVRVQSLADEEFAAAVARTSWALDPSTRTLHTEVDVPNTDGRLRPGMYARVSIHVAEHQDALVVPLTAVVEQDRRAWCFVAVDAIVRRKPVTLGIRGSGEVEIVSGLSGDELVVQAAAASLSEGQPVEIAEAAPSK